MITQYFYSCSKEYIDTIDGSLYEEVVSVLSSLEKREKQSEINRDCFYKFSTNGWSFDSLPAKANESEIDKYAAKQYNNRNLCLTTTTLGADWHSDFAKIFNRKLVQVEVQFGKVEAMFKDFCGFKIAYSERRLALGIEVVINNPNEYFFHRLKSISGMANFNIARSTLATINLQCPLWLIGI